MRRDMLATEGRRGRYHQPTGGAFGAQRKRFLGRAQFVEDIAHILKERRPFRSQGDLARRALEQLDSQLLLKLINTPTDHRGRNPLFTGHRRQTLRFGDIQKRLQRFKAIHLFTPSVRKLLYTQKIN